MGPTLILLLATASSNAGEVKITGASASSTFPPAAGAFYSASMVKDAKLGTSWVEGSPGAGLGQNITIEFASSTVTELHIWAGMWYSNEFWERANRPREIEIKAADGSKTLCKMTDEMTVQICKLDKPTTTDKLTLTYKGSYSGTTWMDTGLTEIRVHDGGPPSWPKIAGATASTTLEDDGDGPYDAARAADGMYDSMWCEGSKDGDGAGEWLQIDLDGTQSIASLSVVNGIGGSTTIWKKGNRASKVTLAFSDGSSKSVTLEDTKKPQIIPIGKKTSFVKLTFDGIIKGSAYNDLCISEARPK